MSAIPKHPQACLSPSVVVTLSLLFVLKGGGDLNHCWIVGGKRGVVLNKWGLVCAWGADTTNAHDSTFHPLVARFTERMIVFADTAFGRKEGNPSNMKVCARGTWNDRMLIETTFSMLTQICHAKHACHRAWRYFTMRLAFTVALFNILVQWDGLPVDKHGHTHRSIAQFSL